MRRHVVVLLGLALAALCFIAKEWPDKDVHVVFCDVGQGDAVVILDGFSQVLVDSGPDDTVMTCLDRYMPFWDKTLELVVLTHPDSDHTGGMAAVLSQYQTRYLLNDLSVKNTDHFKRVEEAFKQAVSKGTEIVLPRTGQVWQVGRVRFDVWQAPESQKRLSKLTETMLWDAIKENKVIIEGENADSIVLFGSFDQKRFLLTGDLEKEGELALLTYPLTTKNHLLKAGHHGSKTSSIPLFIQKVQPENIVISNGKNNRYGHPAPEVLSTLGESGAQIMRTDELGDLDFVIRGATWVLNESLSKRLVDNFLLKSLPM